ncbi:Ent-kaurene synthase, partial [Aspergillus taichungensis]
MRPPTFWLQLQSRIDILLKNLADGCSSPHGLGSMSTCCYDTAWVAMISKEIDGKRTWLFPSSFEYLISSQALDGGWGEGASDIDVILNTMAGLLALKHHQSTPEHSNVLQSDLDDHIHRATSFLEKKLQTWDVESTDHVGFEILVPTHLRLLADQGVTFSFPGLETLINLNQTKLRKFVPEFLYSDIPTTLTHSLEAFAGQIEFDKVKHRLDFGSMMASPSSTAAYLIHASQWNDEAEAFIRSAVELGEGKGSGAVPSAFPITIFELTWVISTLMESGLSPTEENKHHLNTVAEYLEKHFHQQNGVLGFVPTLMADADDTAKTIISLNMLGKRVRPDRLIEVFENGGHFRTYAGERNPSFSANCNILSALLHSEEPSQYLREIELAVQFLCDLHSSGDMRDKWNTCDIYPRMLLAHALTVLLQLWQNGSLQNLSKDLLHKVHIVLWEILVQTIQEQQSTGAWHNGSCEITAYATLTLAAGSNSPLAALLGEKLQTSLVYGRAFLEANISQWDKGETIWVEKVSYSSAVLSNAYCISAVQAPTFTWTATGDNLINIPSKAISKFAQFYSRLPLFAHEPSWRLRFSLIEGSLWFPRLAARRLDIFPRTNMEEDKYLQYIPQTWTMSNSLHNGALEPDLMWEMMVISMLNYQADEFLEAVVEEHLMDQIDAVSALVERLCDDAPSESPFSEVDGPATKPVSLNGNQPDINHVEQVLRRFITYLLTHPAVTRSPPSVQRTLRRELKIFILAHLAHAQDNARFRAQTLAADRTTEFTSPRSSYYSWVRSTSADHTSCPYSFHFLSCLIAKPGEAAFKGPRQRYLAEDMCRHLATMCRQYNDYGSIARDRAEKNLNSVNFPEFCAEGVEGTGAGLKKTVVQVEQKMKDELMWVAEYERECCMTALDRLENETGLDARTKKILRMFVDVTDSYGQIYVARDIASRM